MALFESSKANDLWLGIWKMEESIADLLSLLPHQSFYMEQLERFSAESRKKEWLSVRVLLLALCGEEKIIAYTSTGKPYLEDGSFHISISHTRGYVAVLLHPSKEVGVDIEQCGERVIKVYHKFMVQEEELNICKEKEVLHLLLHWSAKETVYKMMEREDAELREHIRVSSFVPGERGEFAVTEYRTERKQSYLVKYITHPDYVLTYAVL